MSDLIFFGDTVWPTPDCVDLDEVVQVLRGKKLIVNLEGPILPGNIRDWQPRNRFKINTHSSPQIGEIMQTLGVVACGLANNHCNDYLNSSLPTLTALADAGISYFGTEAIPLLEITSGGSRYTILGACSRLPEPTLSQDATGPRLFKPRRLLDEISAIRSVDTETQIICVIHWGYELSLFPQPADREWAHRAIESGADYVIGHHPHVAQGVERINDGFIAYSLGNFILPHGWINGKWLGYAAPESLLTLGFEVLDGSCLLHWFNYDKENSRIITIGTDMSFDEDSTIRELTPYSGMSHAEYRKWFRMNGRNGYLARSRHMPTFNTYFGPRRLATTGAYSYLQIKRNARKALMWAGLHTPRIN